jgi:hypothetical protein
MSDSAIRMIAKQKPLVLLNRQISETSCIVTDNARGTRQAVEHLRMLGHDTITYLAGPVASWAEGMRWRALREATQERDLRVRRVDPHDDPPCAPATRPPPDRRRRRDGRARLPTRSRSASSGPQAARRARAGVSVVGSTTCCSPRRGPGATARRAHAAGALGVGNVLAWPRGGSSGGTCVLR